MNLKMLQIWAEKFWLSSMQFYQIYQYVKKLQLNDFLFVSATEIVKYDTWKINNGIHWLM